MSTYIHQNNEKKNNNKTERQTKEMRMIDRENNSSNRIAFKINKIFKASFTFIQRISQRAPSEIYFMIPLTVNRS